MDELLNKYYEYFLKLDIENFDSFNLIYNLIINKYDIKKDEILTKELRAYQQLYREFGKPYYMPLEVRKRRFGRKNLSFDFFDYPEHLYRKFGGGSLEGFIHTQTHSEIQFCKIYLSIKPKEYITTTIKLRKFIDFLFENYEEEEIGNCKFRKIPANDAVVLRFTSRKQFDEFMKFLEENEDIRENFDLPNPFIPYINGVGIMPDNGNSYNTYVASVLWNYMMECKNDKKDINLSELIHFVQSNEVKIPFINKDISDSNYKEIFISKLMGISDKDIIENFLHLDEYKEVVSKK